MHWRAKSGVGEFNYRFVYDFAVDQRLPIKRPCLFSLKAWDKDPLTFKSDFLGQRELNLSELVEGAMLQIQDQQKHDEKVQQLLEAGRMDEMLLEVQKYRTEKRQKRAEAEASILHWAKVRVDKELKVKSDPDEEGEQQEDKSESRGCMTVLRDCFGQSRMALARTTQRVRVNTYGGSAEDRGTKYKWDHARQWKLRDIEGTDSGTVWVSVELLHQSISKNQPVGKGRDAPNDHPVLEEPERERLSLTSPLGALRYFVGPARLKVARVIVVGAFLLLMAWTALSTSIDAFVRKVVLHDVFSPLTGPTCDGDGGFAKASDVHETACGGAAEFKPQIDHWLECLGPFATLSGLDKNDKQPADSLCRVVPEDDDGAQFRFNWGLCENATKTCNPGMQSQLDTMAALSRERQQAVFDHQCESGGSYYNLVPSPVNIAPSPPLHFSLIH